MSMTEAPRQPLGIGSLIGRSFSLFFSRFILFFVIAFLPIFVSSLVTNWVTFGTMNDLANAADPMAAFGTGYWLTLLLSVIVGFVVQGVLVLSSYDVATGRSVQVGAHLSRTLRYLLPLVILSIVFMFIIGLPAGLVAALAGWAAASGATFVAIVLGLAIIPLALYLLARYMIMTPALLVEPAGWSALGRASTLTKGHRWTIVGGILIMGVIFIVLALLVGLVFGAGAMTVLDPASADPLAMAPGYILTITLVNAAVTAVVNGLLGVFTALVYARLREIKEGLGMEDLSKVFA